MPYHNCIKVEREREKRLYRICKELENNRRSEIIGCNPDYHSTMRKFGIRTKTLIEKNLINPPLVQKDRGNVIIRRVIEVPKDVKVESNGNKIVKFFFRKR